MFRLIRDPEFVVPVTVLMPGVPAPEEMTFSARCRALPVSQLPQIDRLDREGVNDFLRTVVVGWEGVVGDDGQPLEFDEDLLDAMLDMPAVRLPLLTAYFRGLTPAARGN